MRVTPLDIRQKTFEKHFRGYQIEEVNAFLQTLSQEWEKTMDENKELRIKLEGAEREVTKLREVEGSLYKTLKTAEDTGANVIEQARHAADLHLKESQLKSETMLAEARSKAKNTIEESEIRAKEIVAEMEDQLKSLIEQYKKLEQSKEDLLTDLKRLASDTLDRLERAKAQSKEFDADQHMAKAKRETRRIVFPNHHTNEKTIRPQATVVEKEIILEQKTIFVEAPAAPKKMQSFFDEIG